MRSFKTALRGGLLFGLLAAVSACGTTYNVPEASANHTQVAASMFAEEHNPATAKAGGRLSEAAALRQFLQVVSRVEPVAERFCKQETADRPGFDCDINIVVDQNMPVRNAYQTYTESGRPIVAFTLPMIQDARNPDELAFVMGHEMGHHIGQHMHKKQQQAMAGALVVGALAAYSNVGVDQRVLQDTMAVGAGVGNMAYSQTYELESDVIGTAITKAAGYDPVKGARFFARPEEKTNQDGNLSFWGTHPPDQKRLATVLATVDGINAHGGLTKKTSSQ
ncbi:M48 family metalloprotease [Salipiger sp. PrR003]|uniref:M48 family metalloprotease n=1 Tax=Salipiger sp. PrR003 TaxID=2706776 RepID=UPI0013DBBEE7|nr:M48 family metalloprotease [Salipiger sp. PrR003]NDV50611.1 M48 family metalloprotease [Salipiger sp. PrR003]